MEALPQTKNYHYTTVKHLIIVFLSNSSWSNRSALRRPVAVSQTSPLIWRMAEAPASPS